MMHWKQITRKSWPRRRRRSRASTSCGVRWRSSTGMSMLAMGGGLLVLWSVLQISRKLVASGSKSQTGGGVGLQRRKADSCAPLRNDKQMALWAGLEEGDGLDAGDVEAFAAADVLAADQVVGADHVALGLGEAGAIALVGAARDLGLLAAAEPSH